jgi:ribosomal protein S18 acetylase RimI-like enzyme
MDFVVRQMEIEDYDPVWQLWSNSDAIKVTSAESRERIKRLLERNPGMSYVALVDEVIAGAVLCSHDGRIGFLTHLVVGEEHRRKGIGRQLVSRCMYGLMSVGIHQCVLLIMQETEEALKFWRKVDPAGRVSLVMMAPR